MPFFIDKLETNVNIYETGNQEGIKCGIHTIIVFQVNLHDNILTYKFILAQIFSGIGGPTNWGSIQMFHSDGNRRPAPPRS